MKLTNIRALREAAGLTVPQLAASMGVSPVVVDQWETDRIRPRLSDLPLLVKVLGCDYNAVFVEQPFDGCDPDGLCDQYTA